MDACLFKSEFEMVCFVFRLWRKKKSIAILLVSSVKSTPNNVVSIALVFCQRKFNGVSKVFWKAIWKTSSDRISGLIACTLGESKRRGSSSRVLPKMEKN